MDTPDDFGKETGRDAVRRQVLLQSGSSGGMSVGEGLGQERKWKIATVRGEDGHDFDIWAYGRTFEEARKRAAAGDPRVYYRRAQARRKDSPSEE